MHKYAPIALFVYNRPDHTARTLNALAENVLANESELFIYSDAAKTSKDADKVEAVRKIAKAATGFKSVKVIERLQNMGLANSIIQGVTQLVNEYGTVIVFEDDLLTSPYTLQYFNDALMRYATAQQVMHIGAYMYPIKSELLPETFFARYASSWGWATWKRAWDYFEPDIDKLMSQFNSEAKNAFTLEGSMNYWDHMKAFKNKKNNSWAIRWYASMFLKNGLALYPAASLIDNIGHDGTGVHSDPVNMFKVAISQKPVTSFPAQIKEDLEALKPIKYFLRHRKGNLLRRGINFIYKIYVSLKS